MGKPWWYVACYSSVYLLDSLHLLHLLRCSRPSVGGENTAPPISTHNGIETSRDPHVRKSPKAICFIFILWHNLSYYFSPARGIKTTTYPLLSIAA